MKKIITMLCCATLMLMAGCKKEERPNNQGSNPNPGPQPQQHDEREGAYDPVCKITGVTYNDGTEAEVWTWADGKLQHVNQNVQFTYRSDGRVDRVDVANLSLGDLMQGMALSGTMQLNYSGDYISSLAVTNSGTQVLAAQVQHNSSNKVSGATLEMSNDLLVDLFNMVLAQFLNDSTGTGNAVVAVDNVSGNVAFQWEGDNVSQARLNVSFRVESTVGTLVDLVGEENLSMFGPYAQYLPMLPDNQPLYFNVTVGDTVDYTYDNKVNPYKNYLGRVHISCLSANNMDMEVHNGNAHVAISTTILYQTVQVYQTDYPLPIDSKYYEYEQYNSANCPTRIVDQDGVVTLIQYME